MLTQRNDEDELDANNQRMQTLTELNREDYEDTTDYIMDIKAGDKRKMLKNEKMKNKKIAADKKNAEKLAAGWRIVNERLKDIEMLEKRNKSQIKYEVEKAFEMTKYLDETNFTKRDPEVGQAYISLVRMCMSKMENLTPFMILQKIE
jgi:hypothetical protein